MKMFKILAVIIFIIIVILIGGLTNYKSETLYCSKKLNNCHVEKINLFGGKSSKNIVKYSDIQKVSYIRQKVKGNLYAKGYKDYQLVFITKDNSRKIIFSGIYLEKPQIISKIKEIRKELLSNSDSFVLKK